MWQWAGRLGCAMAAQPAQHLASHCPEFLLRKPLLRQEFHSTGLSNTALLGASTGTKPEDQAEPVIRVGGTRRPSLPGLGMSKQKEKSSKD